MKRLLVSDLHLSSAVRDAYRFEVFKHVRKQAEAHDVEQIWILGDLTDAKDYHPARLVNRVCDELARLAGTGKEIHIVRGNHDGIDPEWPYFRFLNHLVGVTFHIKATAWQDGFILPHVRDPKEWGELHGHPKWVMAHATFSGSKGENGQVLPSELQVPREFRHTRVYSGDVHVPQTVGNVVYVGSPHHVHYGDSFKPRMILLDKDKETSIPVPGIRRLMIDIDPQREQFHIDCNDGDQAKVRVHLQEAALGQWQEIRRNVLAGCQKLGLDVAAIELVRVASERRLPETSHARRTPLDVLNDFLRQTPTAPSKDLAALGRDILRELTGDRGPDPLQDAPERPRTRPRPSSGAPLARSPRG